MDTREGKMTRTEKEKLLWATQSEVNNIVFLRLGALTKLIELQQKMIDKLQEKLK